MDLTSNKFINFLLHCLSTAAITVGMIGMFVLWASGPDEIMDDGTIVTIDYDCREVLPAPDDWPAQVVTECRRKFQTMPEISKTNI